MPLKLVIIHVVVVVGVEVFRLDGSKLARNVGNHIQENLDLELGVKFLAGLILRHQSATKKNRKDEERPNALRSGSTNHLARSIQNILMEEQIVVVDKPGIEPEMKLQKGHTESTGVAPVMKRATNVPSCPEQKTYRGHKKQS